MSTTRGLEARLFGERPSFRARPSSELERWLPGESFHDTISVASSASPAELMEALARVRARDMPVATLLGRLRYLPARFASPLARQQARLDLGKPFLHALCSDLGSIMLAQSEGEVIIGTIGKLHQIYDQKIVQLQSRLEFLDFDRPGHEKLAISIRAERAGAHAWLTLEHRTRATDPDAARKFARYFRFIRPAGAFVSRQLLKAAARSAEAESRARRSPSAALPD